MKEIFKIAAATFISLGFAASMVAAQPNTQPKKPFGGMIIVPASAPPSPQIETMADQPSPFRRAKVVDYATDAAPGSIIINTKENRLYYVLGLDRAAMYRVATGKPGFEWAGTHKVSAKTEWPEWRPPVEMLKRRPELPAYMAGGPKNPLGARAMYLGSSIYRIHGTNEPSSIGKAVSSGCIRMLNDDVIELYKIVKVGTQVIVI